MGVGGELLAFVLMDPVDAPPVLLMATGPGFVGDIDLGMHGYRHKKQDELKDRNLLLAFRDQGQVSGWFTTRLDSSPRTSTRCGLSLPR